MIAAKAGIDRKSKEHTGLETLSGCLGIG
jgi:hypothetical protein